MLKFRQNLLAETFAQNVNVNSTRKKLSAILKTSTIVMLLALMLIAVGLNTALAEAVEIDEFPEEAEYPVELEDTEGKTVYLEEEPEEIISMGGSFNEFIVVLEAEDKLIGRGDTYTEVIDEEIGEVASMGSSSFRFQTEKVIELDPDLFIADTMLSDDVRQQLESFDIPVMVEEAGKLERLPELTYNMGKVSGNIQGAQELLSHFNEYHDMIEDRVEELEAQDLPKVYWEWRDAYNTASGEANVNTWIALAGGNNISAGLSGGAYPQVSAEYVWEENPEIIVIQAGRNTSYDSMQEKREEMMEREELQDVTAVQEEQVYVISRDVIGGLRSVVGGLQLAEWFHPELFEDTNPTDVLNDMHEEFYNYEGEEIPVIYPAE